MALRNIACLALDTKAFICKTPILMKLRYYERSAVISVSCNESQVSEAKRAKTCWSNYPTCEAEWGYIVMRPKLQK